MAIEAFLESLSTVDHEQGAKCRGPRAKDAGLG